MYYVEVMIFINNFDRILLCGVNSYQQRRKCGLGLHKHTNDPNTVYVIFSSEVEPNEKLPWERSLQISSSFRGKGGNLHVLRLFVMYFNQKHNKVTTVYDFISLSEDKCFTNQWSEPKRKSKSGLINPDPEPAK